MAVHLPHLFLLTTGLLFLHSPSCTTSGGPVEARDAGEVAADRRTIQRVFVPSPLPENPIYVSILQSCFFCVRDPEDGDLLPVGLLKNDSRVIFLGLEGEWSRVQLLTGQKGLILNTNLRSIPQVTEVQ